MSFWVWASVEFLQHIGARIEEMLEVSHPSVVQYTLPTTGEVVPLPQIAPSKTDEERLLLLQGLRQEDVGAASAVGVAGALQSVFADPAGRLEKENRTASRSCLLPGRGEFLAAAGLRATGRDDACARPRDPGGLQGRPVVTAVRGPQLRTPGASGMLRGR